MYADIATALAATGAFEPVADHEYPWTDDVPAATFVRRLSTHSSHRLLEPTLADRLHTTLLAALDGPSTTLTVAYRTVVLTTTRR
jgi:hypothetical protein